MQTFFFIDQLIRHGLFFATLAAAAVLVLGAAVLLHVSAMLFWAGACIFASVSIFCLVMLLRDIARVIADTLIPMP
jgi:hypothetical protein